MEISSQSVKRVHTAAFSECLWFVTVILLVQFINFFNALGIMN